MIDELTRKKLALEHCRLTNAADVDGLLKLYADDATFEVPAGWKRQNGRDALRAYFEEVVAARIEEVPGVPVAAQDGARAALPVTAVMDYLPRGPAFADLGWLAPAAQPERAHIRCAYVLMIRTSAGGLIQEMTAYWGRSDLEVVD